MAESSISKTFERMLYTPPITPDQSEYNPLDVQLPHKPNATIRYRFFPGAHDSGLKPSLVIFLNGLLTDMDTWLPLISELRGGILPKYPAIFCYDRYGQGFTKDRDPMDEGREPGHGHDCNDVVKDLHELLQFICIEYFGQAPDESFNIVLVGNSIGCAIARLFAAVCTVPIKGFLLLDSVMADSTFDLWPDPDSPGFDPAGLPLELANGGLKKQREAFLSRFGPNVINTEGLSRRSLRNLLPHSDKPSLIRGSVHPWLTIIGHDPEVFAQNSFKHMDTSPFLSMRYTNPTWHHYNQGLTRLTCVERSGHRGVIIANGAGHFVQQDRPDLVLLELVRILDSIDSQHSSHVCSHDTLESTHASRSPRKATK